MQMDEKRLKAALERRDVDVDFYTFEAATKRWPAITGLMQKVRASQPDEFKYYGGQITHTVITSDHLVECAPTPSSRPASLRPASLRPLLPAHLAFPAL